MQVHEYFPGGNTPSGFFSYFDYILPTEYARKRIFLKGGPGTGKSTLMKKVAKLLTERGYIVDRLHCSSDPDSLDAIVAPQLGFCMMDGTAPHIMDPKLPGAVDSILNLGQYWDADKIAAHRIDIACVSKEISTQFENAYKYLAAARSMQDTREKDEAVSADDTQITDLCSALNRNAKPYASGTIKKGFLRAFTPKGIVSFEESFTQTAATYELTERDEKQINRLVYCINESGADAHFFYSPMEPAKKIEYIYLPNENIFIKNNSYKQTETSNLVSVLQEKALHCLSTAKALHDTLEQFYIPYMDFDALKSLPEKIANTLLS